MNLRLPIVALMPLALLACEGSPGSSTANPVRLAPFACGNFSTPIHDIQGSGEASPRPGTLVDVEGVVTGNFQQGLGGFFIEAPAAARDANAKTSEGLFVVIEAPRDEVRPGRLVRIRGSVVEGGGDEREAGLTAVTAVADIALCGDGELPEPVLIDTAQADWEAVESMRITLPGPLTVTGNRELLSQGKLEVSLSGRLFQPTEVALPGGPAREVGAADARAMIALDDNLNVNNPRRIWWLAPAISAQAPWRVGSTLGGVAGIVDHREGEFRLQLTAAPASVTQAARPEAPPEVPGDLRIVSFNVENFFNGNGRGGDFPTARGADSVRAFRQQQRKIVASLAALRGDVVALQELENDGWDAQSAIVSLIDALNAELGRDGDYQAVRTDTERLGKDQIKVGLIYRSSRVRLLGAPATYEQGAFVDRNRVPLAATFEPADGGEAFTVAVNHFKSKGGCEEAGNGDRDQGDDQGCWNATRIEAARELTAWLATNPTAAPNDALLITGDLNAYGREDPIRLIVDRGFRDLFAGQQGANYSFVFRGKSGRLDHALANPAFAARVVGAAKWHINADELELFGYPADRTPDRLRRLADRGVFRSSDHDPLLIGIDSRAPAGPSQ